MTITYTIHDLAKETDLTVGYLRLRLSKMQMPKDERNYYTWRGRAAFTEAVKTVKNNRRRRTCK